MPALNFVRPLAPAVQSGLKLCSIRAKRKRAWKVGDRMVCYTGLRQPNPTKLYESTVEKVCDIRMRLAKKGKRMNRAGSSLRELKVVVDGRTLSQLEIDDLAKRDGFASWVDLFFFFAKRLPFHGDWIFWKKQDQPNPLPPFQLVEFPKGSIKIMPGTVSPCTSKHKLPSSRRKRRT